MIKEFCCQRRETPIEANHERQRALTGEFLAKKPKVLH
jgi:hypothetical protein